MTRSTSSFDPVVISRKGRSSLYKDLSTPIDLISKTKISLYQPQTAADLLNLENKVYVQKSQQGGGSPMIRGFSQPIDFYSAVDGVRMNTAIFREGNVQNVIAIDQFTIGNCEVIFGPASQFYGSDAIGGVLSFETINPAYANSDTLETAGNVSLRYSSASNEQTVHTDFSFSKRKFASFSSITFNNFGDLKTGKSGPDVYTRPDYVVYTGSNDSIISNSDKNLQVLSGYQQADFFHKTLFQISKNNFLLFNTQFSTSSNINRFDKLNDLKDGLNKYLHWYYGPQKRILQSCNLSIRKPAKIYDSILVTAAFQRFEESRNDRNLYDTKLRQRVETVHAYSLSGDFYKELKNKASFNYGLDYVFNRVGSSGIKLDINDGTSSPTSTRYPDGSAWSSAGVYTNFMQRLRKWYTLEFGFRYNVVNTNGTFDTTFFAYPVQSFNNTNEALTGSIGHIFKLKKGSISLVTSTAFRSPNIDDIAKVFDRNTGFVTVPNPDLAPEYAYNAEVNFNYLVLPKLKISTSIFYTYLEPMP